MRTRPGMMEISGLRIAKKEPYHLARTTTKYVGL